MENSAADGPKESERAFGSRVRELRSAHGWTQADLVEGLAPHGIALHQSAVAKIESGSRPTSVGEVVALAATFGVPVGELFPEEDSDQGVTVRVIEATTDTARSAQRLLDAVRAVRVAEHELRKSVEDLEVVESSVTSDASWTALMDLEHVLDRTRRAKAQASAALAELAAVSGGTQ